MFHGGKESERGHRIGMEGKRARARRKHAARRRRYSGAGADESGARACVHISKRGARGGREFGERKFYITALATFDSNAEVAAQLCQPF